MARAPAGRADRELVDRELVDVEEVKLLGVVVFIIALFLWALFAAAWALHAGSLDSAWRSYQDASLVLKGVELILLLPWIAGLWIRQQDWAAWFRIVVVAGLAWTSIWAMSPWRRK